MKKEKLIEALFKVAVAVLGLNIVFLALVATKVFNVQFMYKVVALFQIVDSLAVILIVRLNEKIQKGE